MSQRRLCDVDVLFDVLFDVTPVWCPSERALLSTRQHVVVYIFAGVPPAGCGWVQLTLFIFVFPNKYTSHLTNLIHRFHKSIPWDILSKTLNGFSFKWTVTKVMTLLFMTSIVDVSRKQRAGWYLRPEATGSSGPEPSHGEDSLSRTKSVFLRC